MKNDGVEGVCVSECKSGRVDQMADAVDRPVRSGRAYYRCQDLFIHLSLSSHADPVSEPANYPPFPVEKHPNSDFRTQWQDPVQFVKSFLPLRIQVTSTHVAHRLMSPPTTYQSSGRPIFKPGAVVVAPEVFKRTFSLNDLTSSTHGSSPRGSPLPQRPPPPCASRYSPSQIQGVSSLHKLFVLPRRF